LPITPCLDDFNVNPGSKRVLGVALEMTRISLGLGDNFANEMIAKQIIEIAKTGERNPDLLCEGALKKLRGSCSETKHRIIQAPRPAAAADFLGS
jgi:hypothetical protein